MKKIDYKNLNDRQKESYNFQKISAVLADYGFTTYLMHNDYLGADFHAVDTQGDVIKVQLKGRLAVDAKYLGKGLFIGFPYQSDWYLIPHDGFYYQITNHSKGAKKNKGRSMGKIPSWILSAVKKYKL